MTTMDLFGCIPGREREYLDTRLLSYARSEFEFRLL